MPSFEEQLINLCTTNKIVYSGELRDILLTLNQNILTIRRDIQLRLEPRITSLETVVAALEKRIATLETEIAKTKPPPPPPPPPKPDTPPGKSNVRIGKK
jgi:hypothetical protein